MSGLCFQLALLVIKVVPKNTSNLFQTFARRFGDEEEREYRSSKARAAKEKISAPAKLELHLRYNHADDKVRQPHHGSRSPDTLGALGAGEDLRREGPRQGPVRSRVREDVDV